MYAQKVQAINTKSAEYDIRQMSNHVKGIHCEN